jgi:hypothetical protein
MSALTRIGILSWCALCIGHGRADTTTEIAGRIDEGLLKTLALEQGVIGRTPAAVPVVLPPLTDDATFIRRVSIDLAGRLPTADEVRAFLASDLATKRADLIDRLALSREASDLRYLRLADLMRVTDKAGERSLLPFADWLRKSVRDNVAWDELMRQMLLASGNQSTNPATGFLLRDEGNRLHTAVAVGSILLGTDFHCSQCHDHPFADWTQMQTYQLAACLPPVRGEMPAAKRKPKKAETLLPGARRLGRTMVEPPVAPPDEKNFSKAGWFGIAEGAHNLLPGMRLRNDYKYVDGKPGDVVGAAVPVFTKWQQRALVGLRGRPMTVSATRDEVVTTLFKLHRERIARVMALRVWIWMFGFETAKTDLREGDADLGEISAEWLGSCSSGLTNSLRYQNMVDTPFVQLLGQEFERCGYDLREFQRIIASTVAYQRQAVSSPPMGQPQFTSAPVIRRLAPGVIWDSFQQWQGAAPITRAVEQPAVVDVAHPLRLLGRGTRQWTEEETPLIAPGIARFFANGEPVHQAEQKLAACALEDLFLTILGRPATTDETSAFALSGLSSADAAWALINTTEFLFQH